MHRRVPEAGEQAGGDEEHSGHGRDGVESVGGGHGGHGSDEPAPERHVRASPAAGTDERVCRCHGEDPFGCIRTVRT